MESQPHLAPNRPEQPGHLTAMCQSHDWGNQDGLEGLCGLPQFGRLDQVLHVRREHVVMESVFYLTIGPMHAQLQIPSNIHIIILKLYSCLFICLSVMELG